jgi:ATP-dependent HslUV protease subunit HslV
MTTILAVRHKNQVAVGGDGQVTLGSTVVKQEARKIRRISDSQVLVGFAGASADAMALVDKFETMLKKHNHNMLRAAVELAKEWRMDRVLRRLESVLLAADKEKLLLISGGGDVIEPDDAIAGIGSGGGFAVAAARALVKHSKMTAEQIVRESLEIASGLCIYTNAHIHVETL